MFQMKLIAAQLVSFNCTIKSQYKHRHVSYFRRLARNYICKTLAVHTNVEFPY